MAFVAAIFLFLYFSREGTERGDSSNGAAFIPEPSRVVPEGKRGETCVCPVCAALFEPGDNVKSKILPPGGQNYRILHISGCKFCLGGDRRRLCPVCGAELSTEEYLVARIWQKPDMPEVRIQGCVHCITGGKHGGKVKKLR
ncbi:MAG: hypothetical protein LBF80_07250 [Spirochaetaceae bacterium]|jgi:hypothetical protein|nr:hypothetical protein [Spirochaetaceae bacterium]